MVISLLVLGGAGFYLYQKNGKLVESLTVPEPKFEDFIPAGAKLGDTDLIANTGRTDEEGVQPGKIFLDLDQDGIQEVAFVYSFPSDPKKSEENIYYTPANGMKILKYFKSGWGIIYENKTEESTGDKNYISLRVIKSVSGKEALVVTRFSSGLDWNRRWEILTMTNNEVVSVNPYNEQGEPKELLAQVQRSGYDFLDHSDIVVKDDEIIDTMSGFSSKGGTPLIPDKDPVEAHYKFTGSSIELVSFKILKGVNQRASNGIDGAIPTADRKIYRNEKYGYEFQYDKNFYVFDEPFTNGIYVAKEHMGNRAIFSVSFFRSLGEMPLGLPVEQRKSLNDLKRNPDFQNAQSIEFLGYPALRATFTNVAINYSAIEIIVQRDSGIYEISYNSNATVDAEKILSTFKFTN